MSACTRACAYSADVLALQRPEKKEDEKKLQWCNACEGFKPPRSHHCQTCGHCVAKMDHHCPWINSCVGNNNHFAFLTFVCSVPVGCSYAFVINVFYFMEYCPSIRAALWIAKYQPQFMDEIIFIFVGSIFAIAVTIAVGMLAIFQLMGAAKNQTQIEAWIVEKANNRERDPLRLPLRLRERGGQHQGDLQSLVAFGWRGLDCCRRQRSILAHGRAAGPEESKAGRHRNLCDWQIHRQDARVLVRVPDLVARSLALRWEDCSPAW